MRYIKFLTTMLVLISLLCGGGNGFDNAESEEDWDAESDVTGDEDKNIGEGGLEGVMQLEVGEVADIEGAEGIVALEKDEVDETFLAVVYSGKFESEREIHYYIEVEGSSPGAERTTRDAALSSLPLFPHRPPVGLQNDFYAPRSLCRCRLPNPANGEAFTCWPRISRAQWKSKRSALLSVTAWQSGLIASPSRRH